MCDPKTAYPPLTISSLIPLPHLSGGIGGGSVSQDVRGTGIRNTGTSTLNANSNNGGGGGTNGSSISRPITRVDIQPVINRSDLKSSIFHPNFHRQFVTNISTESSAVPPVNEENNRYGVF